MKKESGEGRGDRGVQEETQGVVETYKLLSSIIKLPTVFTFCVLLLTAKVHQCDSVKYLVYVHNTRSRLNVPLLFS